MKTNINHQVERSQKKIQQLEFELAVEKAVLKRLETLGGKPQVAPRRRTHTGPIKAGSLAGEIRAVLKASAGPLSVAEIVESLTKRGYQSKASAPLNTQIPSAILRRPNTFVKIRRGVYDLKLRQRNVKESEEETE